MEEEKLDILYRALFLRTDTGLAFASGYYVGCVAGSECGKVSGVSGVRGLLFA